ncbi:hypothetical protein SAMN05216228_103256 [Rhizobium tibeticum]|uniref:Uncharacterized protein n=1 Tax=Rhizobium tibeticum TaxID=501024 RepID=A0A1H8U864_9HYPH|nr:hypothetical protein RTCCBAU85039_5390 [Rhizobium tibeticum]SEO99247.1 hypothetical protein SAMN05216228_103256 [Rhizobium tibeticum]
MFVAVGEHEEQALTLMLLQQGGKAAGTQRGESLKHHIEIFLGREFVARFEDRAPPRPRGHAAGFGVCKAQTQIAEKGQTAGFERRVPLQTRQPGLDIVAIESYDRTTVRGR